MVMPDAFHLGWMGATRRLFHIAEALKVMGFEVALIAGAMTNPTIQAEVDAAFPGQVIRLNHTGDYPALIDTSKFLRRCWRIFWKMRGGGFYWSKLSWGWADKININELFEQILTMDSAPSMVWGVGAGYLEGGVAARHIAKLFNLPWIFELQDPPWRSGLGPSNSKVEKCFSELLYDSSKIVVTSLSYKKKLIEDYCIKYEKIKTIHLSYNGEKLNENFNQKLDTDKFIMVYAGALNASRNLESFLIAMKDAINTFQEMKETLRLEVAGAGSGFKDLNNLSLKLHLEDSIISHGLIPSYKVAEIIERAAVVLVIQDQSCFFQVPGKVFEIIKTGKTVLGMMPKNCEAAEILIKSGCGVVHEMDDIESIRKTLISMWGLWRSNKILTKPNWNFISEFSTEKLPTKLAEVLNNIDCFSSDAEVELIV